MIQFLHNLLIRDWLLKLFSLTLAVLTWLAVSFSLRHEVVEVPGKPDVSEKPFYDVPVVVISAAGDARGFLTAPAEVDVVLQGDKQLLEGLEKRQVHLVVELNGTQSASGLKRRVEVITPPGISHTRITPAEVEIIPRPAPQSEPESK
jgi:hypothetical protein